MATKYVTLKDSNGDTLYPQAVATNLVPGSVTLDEIDSRLLRMLIPEGATIPVNEDLNTTQYLSVGKFFCSSNATAQTLSNCPTTNAFMMEVFSPLSLTIDDETTANWCYRLRLITDYTGKMFIQRTNTSGTAGTWTYFDWTPVNPSTTVGSYSITNQAAHSGGTNKYALKKQLNHITLSADVLWVNSVTADTWTQLGTLPSEVRPSQASYCAGVAVNSNGGLLGYCRIEVETNGKVSFKCSAGNSGLSGVSFNISWFV